MPKSKAWLYHGCRNQSENVFEDEARNIVHRHTAMSRINGKEKKYVQHLLARDQSFVYDFIAFRKGYIYICGSVSYYFWPKMFWSMYICKQCDKLFSVCHGSWCQSYFSPNFCQDRRRDSRKSKWEHSPTSKKWKTFGGVFWMIKLGQTQLCKMRRNAINQPCSYFENST